MIGHIVYIDESGNDGDVAGNSAALAERPTFVLAGVVEQDGSAAAAQLVERLRLKHHLQAKDLKWKNFAKKPVAFLQLVRELRRDHMVPFVEVMNRRHYVANNLMTYVLGQRQLDFAEPETLQIANACADVLATEIGDHSLSTYLALCKSPSQAGFETFLLVLRAGLQEAIERATRQLAEQRLGLLLFVDELLGAVNAEWQVTGGVEDVHRYVQEPDQSVGGHRLGLLPQVQAFCNLCGRLNAYIDDEERVRLVHDEQKEFGSLMRHYLDLLASNKHRDGLASHTAHAQASVSWDFPADKFRLDFDDSKRSAGVQIADTLAGFCRSRFDDVNAGKRPDARFDEAAHELAAFLPPAGLLLQATSAQVQAFLP